MRCIPFWFERETLGDLAAAAQLSHHLSEISEIMLPFGGRLRPSAEPW
jgi:hypothetical protein